MAPQLLPLCLKAVVDKAKGPGRTDGSRNSLFLIQLKKLCRALSNLETKVKQEEDILGSSAEDVEVGKSGIVLLGGKERAKVRSSKEMTVSYAGQGEVEKERWKKIINDHKE